MKNIAAVFVIFCSTVFHKCLCYPTGAPQSQCDSMIPNHGSAAQTVKSPYEVKVEKPYYMPEKKVKLSIESSNDNFKGFLIEARKVGENSVTGMFATPPTNTKYVNCNSNAQGAITHKKILSVKTIRFEWEPPMNFSGNVSFFATVVKNKATFWVKLQSPELYMNDMPTKSTPTSNNTCKYADNAKCDGTQLHHNNIVFVSFMGLFLAIGQIYF